MIPIVRPWFSFILGSFMWLDLRILLLLFSQEPRNRTDLRQTQNKRFMKNKYTACYCKWCRNTIPAVSFRVSSLRFLHGIVFATQTLWIHVFVQYVLSGSDWGRHSKSCCKPPLGNMAVSTAWQIESFGKKHEIAQVTAQLQAQVKVANPGQKHKKEMFNELQIRSQAILDDWCEVEPTCCCFLSHRISARSQQSKFAKLSISPL